MNDGIELAALQPAQQLRRRDEISQLALGQVAPLAIAAEMIADGHVRPPGVIQRGDHVRSDKPGPAGYQQHDAFFKSLNLHATIAPDPSGGQPLSKDVVKPTPFWTRWTETANAHSPTPSARSGRQRQAIDKMSENLSKRTRADTSPILLIPYMWIGDFVRCHTVVRVLKDRWPDRPVDVLTDKTCVPLVDYMPGVRRGIVWDLPRRRLALAEQFALASELRKESYGSALVMSRKWKAALAPALAGIPERTGFTGEARFGLLNDRRHGEKALPRMVDQCAALALPAERTPSRRVAAAAACRRRR